MKNIKTWAIVLAIIGVMALSAIIITGMVVGSYNRASTIKNTYEAKISSNQAEFDNLKKKISQTAQVSDMQMEKLKEIFTAHADARSSKSENQLMTWIQESVPNVDQSTFKNLQNIIIGSRDSWTMRQTELVDLSRAYNEMLVVFPNNLILDAFGFQKIKPLVITSTDTTEAFETGKDDKTEVFKK